MIILNVDDLIIDNLDYRARTCYVVLKLTFVVNSVGLGPGPLNEAISTTLAVEYLKDGASIAGQDVE
jgi:hypothetical protein